jgi:hypothetical protein
VTDWLDVVLTEYTALRSEVLRAMETQQTSLSFGAATIGILAAGGFNAWEHEVPAGGTSRDPRASADATDARLTRLMRNE